MGGQDEEIQPCTITLVMADGSTLETLGQTLPLKFCINKTTYEWAFLLVENLGSDHIILGRDFLKQYNITVNLHKGTMETGRTDINMPRKISHTIDGKRTKYIATTIEPIVVEPGQICKVKLRIRSAKHPDREITNTPKSAWLAYIQGRENPDKSTKGLCFSHTITPVYDSIAEITVMNADIKNAKILPANALVLRVHEVLVKYSTSNNPTQDKYPTLAEIKQKTQQNEDVQINKISQQSHITDTESIHTDMESLRTISDYPIDVYEEGQPNKDFPTRPDLTKVKEHLTKKQFQQLNDIIDEHDAIFSKKQSDIRYTNLIKHDIELTEGAEPFREAFRRQSPEKRAITKSQLEEMLEMGVVIPSTSPFASAIVLVKKPDGSIRLCVDFRKLNAITVKDAYPLPRIDDSLESLGSARYFTSLDMNSAFWQIPLTENSKRRTAFVADGGLYQFETMAFGLCNATSTFQRLMSKAFSTISNRYGNLVLCYVDDILIATRTVDEHFDRLKEVFTCLQRAGLKLKSKKCHIMERQVSFLGRIIDEKGIRPDPKRTEAIRNWKRPVDRTTLKSFLGLANYYREFIYKFAELAAPLNAIDRKNKPFIWTELCEEAFNAIKEALITAPILALPTETGEFVLDTDASAVAISGILQQWQEVDGKQKLRVISYGSRALHGSERSYGAPKAEMLAVVTFIDRFRSIPGGKEFLLRTDCQALRWLKTWSTSEGMVARWIARIDGTHFRYEQTTKISHERRWPHKENTIS